MMEMIKKIPHKWVSWAVISLAVVGLGIAGYLTYEHFTLSKEIGFCPIFHGGCNVVLTSKYSAIFWTVPNAILGMLYYLSIAILTILFLWKKAPLFFKLAALLSIFGAGFSIYLLYVQAVLIGQFCFYCVSSAIISILIFLIEIPFLAHTLKKKEI